VKKQQVWRTNQEQIQKKGRGNENRGVIQKISARTRGGCIGPTRRLLKKKKNLSVKGDKNEPGLTEGKNQDHGL